MSPLRLGLPEDRVCPVRLGLHEVGLCLFSDWGSLRAGLCLPSDWGSLRAGLCLPSDWGFLEKGWSALRLGLPEVGLCLPSDWGSLRAGLCVPSDCGSLKQAKLCDLQFESPTGQEFLVPSFYFKSNLPSCMRLTPLPFLPVS